MIRHQLSGVSFRFFFSSYFSNCLCILIFFSQMFFYQGYVHSFLYLSIYFSKDLLRFLDIELNFLLVAENRKPVYLNVSCIPLLLSSFLMGLQIQTADTLFLFVFCLHFFSYLSSSPLISFLRAVYVRPILNVQFTSEVCVSLFIFLSVSL